MTETYSTYEAKAKLSEILRKVERGGTVRISRHGKQVAEIRPVPIEQIPLADRIRDLIDQGVVVPASRPREPVAPLARRPGALGRFLVDRHG